MDPARPSRPAARVAGVAAALLVLGLLAFGLLWWSLPGPAEWSTRNPSTTALIEQRRAEARAAGRRWQPDQRWVPLARLSPRLAEAVVASEDAKFWAHGGFDWDAMQDAARENLRQRRFARGASTLTQQLAKNLWFGTEKSLVRKAREALQAARLERTLGKRRILELYLNVVEWGDGVFGAEAAARHHLGTGAGALTTAQSVLLASMLPAPRRADLAHPAPWLVGRAVGLLTRLHAEKALGDAEYATARDELAGLLGLARPPPAEAASAALPEPPADDAPEPAPPPAAAPEPSPGGEPTGEPAPSPAPAPSEELVPEPVPEPERAPPAAPAGDGR